MRLQNIKWPGLLKKSAFVLFIPVVICALFHVVRILGYEGLGEYGRVVQWFLIGVPAVAVVVALISIRMKEPEKSRLNERVNLPVSSVVLLLGILSLVIDLRKSAMEPLVTASAHVWIDIKPCRLMTKDITRSWGPDAVLSLAKGKARLTFMDSSKFTSWGTGGRGAPGVVDALEFEFVLSNFCDLIGKPLARLKDADALLLRYVLLPPNTEILGGKCRIYLNGQQLKEIAVRPQTLAGWPSIIMIDPIR